MELLQFWLSCFIHYILAFFKLTPLHIKADTKSHLLLLPPEILFEILNYLDYRALINARQTCKAFHGMMNSERFWANLARDLCSTPGIGKLTYPLGNYSTTELMRWTLRRLQARDRWISDDLSQSLRFRSRLVDGGSLFCGAELLRGGRWLFTIQDDGATHIIDLEQKPSRRQFLFTTDGPSEADYLSKFRIWIDETKQELSFRVATYSWETDTEKYTRICIHQIDSVRQGSSFVVTPIAVLRDYPRTTVRSWTALSDKYFLQSFAERDEDGCMIGPRPIVVIQLRRYSRDSSHTRPGYMEKRVQVNGLTNVFFLPGDRAGFVALMFMKIYAISSEQDTLPAAKLVLLHHVPTPHTPNLLSVPFVGSHCTYLVGVYRNMLRKIIIDHDRDSPPTIQELGNLKPVQKRSSVVRLGPSASVVFRSERLLEFITYEHFGDREYFQRKFYNIPKSRSVIGLVAFDASTGCIVLESNAERNQLVVLDMI